MKKKRRHVEAIVGIAWYRRDQWDMLKKVSDEPEILEDTYEEWIEYAKELKGKLERSRLTVKEVDIDMVDVIKWCKNKNTPINSNSITEYVGQRLKDLEKQSGI